MQGYDIKPAKWLSMDMEELWHFRELFVLMAWRDIKVKYKQTVLGLLWVILQPLILMLIFNVLWLNVLKARTVDIPYPLFAYCGLMFWGLFSSGISNASDSMISNANIIKKVYFPRIIIPAAALIAALFDFMVTLVLYMLLIFYYQPQVSIIKFICLLPLSIGITCIASFGLSLIIASTTIQYRDFRYIVPFGLQAFFFLTPVVIPLSVYASEPVRLVLSLNPMAGAINLARSALTNDPVNWGATISSMAIAVVLLIAGLAFFRKTESQYADLL